MRVKVPVYRTSCLPFFVVMGVLAGCQATVTQYQADGKTVESVIRVPMGMRWDATTESLAGDPTAIEAMGAAASKLVEAGGETLARYAIEKAAEANTAQKNAEQ